jgi:sec-independent protein translocase protein TatA
MPLALGGPELVIILVIVLVVFGAGRLPGALKDVGRGMKEFRKAQMQDGAAAGGRPSPSRPKGDAPPPPLA